MRKRIAMAQGDMTGDGAAETVILTGEQREGTAYWQNIELEIIDGRSGKSVRVALALNEGYEPQLLLGCMTARNRGRCADCDGHGIERGNRAVYRGGLRERRVSNAV